MYTTSVTGRIVGAAETAAGAVVLVVEVVDDGAEAEVGVGAGEGEGEGEGEGDGAGAGVVGCAADAVGAEPVDREWAFGNKSVLEISNAQKFDL